MVMARGFSQTTCLPAAAAIPGHLRMQAIGSGDGHHLDVFFFEHLAVIRKHARDAEFLGKGGGVSWAGGGDGNNFGFVRHDLKRGGVNIRLKLRSDDSDFYSALVPHAISGLLNTYGFSDAPQRFDPDVAEPDFGAFCFQENSAAGQRDHVGGIIRVGPLDVAGIVHDPAIHQVRGSISQNNYFHCIPAVPVLEVAGLQHAE